MRMPATFAGRGAVIAGLIHGVGVAILRQYFPRSSDLGLHSAAHLNAVARRLNGRPRQTLNWMKPSEVFSRTVASID
jgi:hypothetical protein